MVVPRGQIQPQKNLPEKRETINTIIPGRICSKTTCLVPITVSILERGLNLRNMSVCSMVKGSAVSIIR
jgi:hypothetical protein